MPPAIEVKKTRFLSLQPHVCFVKHASPDLESDECVLYFFFCKDVRVVYVCPDIKKESFPYKKLDISKILNSYAVKLTAAAMLGAR